MKTTISSDIATFSAVVLLTALPAVAQDVLKPKYAADVPEFLLTPDQIETEVLGTLEFFDGMPSKSTAQKTYDFLDLSRGVDAFLNGMPAASIYAFLEGPKQVGMEPGDLGITESPLDARGLLLTAQSTTPYALAEIDLKNGPVVVEIPGPVLGAGALVDNPEDVLIIGHPKVNETVEASLRGGGSPSAIPEVGPAMTPRLLVQFNNFLPDEGPDAALGGKLEVGKPKHHEMTNLHQGSIL